MRGALRIGEVARLLGVTTKTIRHYHKVGLLAEPPRATNGYRLYGAGDLLRLGRIRRLQALGLPLRRIATILGAPDDRQLLRDVLAALDADLAARVANLEERRGRIAALLGGDLPDALDAPAATPPLFRWARETLAAQLPDISPALLRQEERLWGVLDAFAWPEGYRQGWRSVAEYYAAHPEQLRCLHDLSERLVALVGRDEDDPEVERLADDCARYLREHPLPPELPTGDLGADDPLARTLGEVLHAGFSPAQRRFGTLMRRHLSAPAAGAK